MAYKAKKRVLLVASVNVIGKSCDVAAQVTPEVGGKYRVEISFPIISLKSGEEERDQDVAKLLGVEQDPEMHFVSAALSHEEWQEMLKGESATLAGELRFAQETKPMSAVVAIKKTDSGVEVDGVIKTSFKELNLKAPEMLMGLFAKVGDELELHFHLLGSRTMGADSIL